MLSKMSTLRSKFPRNPWSIRSVQEHGAFGENAVDLSVELRENSGVLTLGRGISSLDSSGCTDTLGQFREELWCYRQYLSIL